MRSVILGKRRQGKRGRDRWRDAETVHNEEKRVEMSRDKDGQSDFRMMIE